METPSRVPLLCCERSARRTRYFRFSRISPTAIDYDVLDSLPSLLNAYVSYRTNQADDVSMLYGFIVLHAQPATLSSMRPHLPGFLLTTLPPGFELPPPTPRDDHPYRSVRRILYPYD